MPFYTDAKPNSDVEKEYFGKAHRPYSEERHGTKPAIYIVRDPVDVVPSCASFFGVSIPRMAEEVAKDWPRHVQSWVGHASLFIRYEDMPRHFHTLAQHLSVPSDFESVVTAISHSAFDTLQQDEAENGFAEASEKQKAFFRKGETGSGREVMDPATVRKVIKGAGEWYHRFGYRD